MQILQQAMPKPPRHPDREFHPVEDGPTPESIERCKAATRQERIDNGLDPETGKPLDTLTALVGELSKFTAANPGVVVEFRPRPEPPAPQPDMPADVMGNVTSMQLAESVKQSRIASAIAHAVYGAELQSLTRRDKATCLFLACAALRGAQEHWTREAENRAREAGVHALRTECGAAFRHLPQKQLEVIAATMWAHQRAAYTRITEGTEYLEPGRYLAIVKGQL